MVIFGWRRWGNILGAKIDDCLICGAVGRHFLVRKPSWFTLFFIPVLLFHIQHGMVCAACGEWTGIPMLTMIRGVRAGRLPLARPRPHFEQLPPDAWGRVPLASEVLDPVSRNPKTPVSGWYVRLWPIVAPLAIAALVAWSALAPVSRTLAGQRINTDMQTRYGRAHDCWKSGNDIVGCKLQEGTIEGDDYGTMIVCYFDEPLDVSALLLHCR